MKLYDFNLLFSQNKRQTKVIVTRGNELFKENSIWTIGEAKESIDDYVRVRYPYKDDATKKQIKSRDDKIERLQKSIVEKLELKHR